MKKLSLIIALGGALASYQCSALTVDVNVDRPDYSTSPGGEFNITLDSSDAGDPAFAAILQNYNSAAIVNGGFETFCINTSIPFNSPAVASLSPGPVTLGTAFLYYEFAKGTLTGYNYTTLGATGRGLSAWELQNAIWTLQGQTVYDSTAAAVFLTSSQFTSVFGTGSAGITAAEQLNNGTYHVDELNLNAQTGGTTYQPMLALVPDGGITAMMLGMGLSGLFMVSRKLRRA